MQLKLCDINPWEDLSGVYEDASLRRLIEEAEKSFLVTEEIEYFKNLVNTSRSKDQPFHRWLRYREGYAGELVKEIISRYPLNPASDFVLDPMCGSGSTNVACREMGIDSLGLDVNPYAVLSTSVKTKSVGTNYLTFLIQALEKLESDYKNAPNKKLNRFDKGVAKYFDPERIQKLTNLKELIRPYRETEIGDFLWLGLLGIIEDCSNRKKDGNGLARRPSQIRSIFDRFLGQQKMMIEDIQTEFKSQINTEAKCFSALRLDEEVQKFREANGKELGSIIFSPPYANSFDYFESYKMELVFGEYTELKGLADFRKVLIRNYRIGYGEKLKSRFVLVNKLCEEIHSKIPLKEKRTGVRDGRTRLVPNMLVAYFDDMHEVIGKSYEALRPGGSIHIVVDQSSYVGVPIPTDTLFAILGRDIGFKVDSIIKCRRANTSGQQLKQFPYLKRLLRETIITMTK